MGAALMSALALMLASPAASDGPITTAPAAGPTSPPPTPPAAQLPPPRAELDEEQPMAMGPCGPEKVKADGSLENKPHGEVEAGIGSRGYRSIGGSICQPIGKDGFVAASVSDSQSSGYGGRHH